MPVASVYENGGIIGQTLDFGSTDYYQEVQNTQNNSFTIHATLTSADNPADDNPTLTIPSTVQDGDLLVVACGHTSTPISEANMASGWTVLANSDDNSNGTPSVQSVILYKIATASDASTVFNLHTNSNDGTQIDYKLFVIRPDDGAIQSGTTFTTGEDSYKTFNNPPQLSVNPSGSSGPVFAIAAYAVNTGAQPSASPTPTGNDAVDVTDFYVSHWVYSRADTKPSSITWDAGDGGRNAVSLAYIEIPDGIGSVNKNRKNSGIWNLNAVYNSLYFAPVTYSISHITSATDGTDGTSFTFTSQSLGGTDANDVIVVIAGGEESTTTSGLTQISSITVDGTSATSQVQAINDNSSVRHICGLYAVTGVSSSTGNVVVTFDGSMKRCIISVYRITGTSGTLPSVSTDSASGQAATVSAALSTTGGGGAVSVAAMYVDAGSSTITATGGSFTEDVETTGVEGTQGSFASYSESSGSSTVSTTLTASVTPDEFAAVMCTFSP